MRSAIVCLFFIAQSFAAPYPEASSTGSAPSPQSTACGDIVNSDNIIFDASQVFDCLTSVPFNAAIATRFITYLNDTLQFQSTLAYLKNPPSSYQQARVDLLGELSKIQTKVNQGVYNNEYAFEADIQFLLQSAHDSHLDLLAGAIAAFSFGTENELVSVSPDGIQLPKIYLADDIFEAQDNENFTFSEIVQINGQEVTQYLSDIAARNAYGTVEPHADWNQLFSSPALDIQGSLSLLGGDLSLYPGDKLTYTFKNGSTLEDPWRSIYWGPAYTGPLSTGGDFYNLFVLGLLPASYDNIAAANSSSNLTGNSSDDTTSLTSWNEISDAYPDDPFIVQPDLAITGGGFITGYTLSDISTAVVSIPSFEEYGDAVDTFTKTIQEFLVKSKKQGMKKIVVDVQQNEGGNTFLAIDTYKRFFPSLEPFGGSRMRATPYADVIGSSATDFWDHQQVNSEDYEDGVTNEWVVTDRINAATGQNFTSWAEFFGPNTYNNDTFTNVQRYNFSSDIFDVEALSDNGTAVYGYANNAATVEQLYAAEDIIILSDAICHSACALFMEMMHHEAGVRSVVVGGRPSYGPMQTPSGTRGASVYGYDDIDSDIEWTKGYNSTANSTLPDRTEDIWVTVGDINLRDQVRRNETIPVQFVYEAADCRIFFTPQTVFNMTNLWKYAANAIWSDRKLCVQGSTGFAVTGNTTDIKGPEINQSTAYSNITSAMPGVEHNIDNNLPEISPLEDGVKPNGALNGKPCTVAKGCEVFNQACVDVQHCEGSKLVSTLRCATTCDSRNHCPAGSSCNTERTDKSSGHSVSKGFCKPQFPHPPCGKARKPNGPVRHNPPKRAL